MNYIDRVRTVATSGLDRLTRAVVRRAALASQRRLDVDLLLADQLRRCDRDLEDPAAWVAFLRASFCEQVHVVQHLRHDEDAPDERSVRFNTLVEHLASGVPTLPTAVARELADLSDQLRSRRDPIVTPTYAADVGQHAALSSTDGAQARMLATVVRCMASRRIVEVGTAYGIGTLALARTTEPDTRIVTIEPAQPMHSIARENLERAPGVTVLQALAVDAGDAARNTLDGPCDLFFHDGSHTRDSYISDFAAFEPLLASGAIVVFDDINWSDDRFHADAHTYDGWRIVAAHERVRVAVEVDGTWGLLLLH